MKYNIVALKRKMLVKYPFFGSVVASVEYKENKDISTAGTDGEIIYYNPEYLENLGNEEQIFIFAHEICHIAFNHIIRNEGKDPELWNIATDGVINQFLKSDGLKMVPGVVDIKEAINYDAEQLYEKLLQEKQQIQKQGDADSCKASQVKEKQQDIGHDTHSMWKQSVKKYKVEQEKSDKKEKKESELEKKQEELEGIGEKYAFNKNIEDKKKKLEELKRVIFKQASQIGISTNSDVRSLTDIKRAKPLIDWQYILKEAIKYEMDWSYKNATIEDGVVTANLEEQSMPETEIVLDTSDSISEVLLKNFLRECKSILQTSEVKVGCFDTKFYGFYEVRTEEDIENMKFIGGGGTNFDVTVNAFTRNAENKIIFTDGMSSMPNTPMDAIWIVFGSEKINPKGGKAIYIDDEQLEKLYNYQMSIKIKRKSR